MPQGADAEAGDPRLGGGSALFDAAVYGSAAAAELLLRSGAAVDARNRDCETALHWAAERFACADSHAAACQVMLS